MAVRAPESHENYGEVFTRRWVVEVILDLTGYASDRDLAPMCLVEPSCGSGAFLGPAVERLLTSASQHGRPFASLTDAVRAYDVQAANVASSRAICRELLTSAGAPSHIASELAATWVRQGDFLLDHVDLHSADIIVGNPPYIRYDDIPYNVALRYRETWPTMRGRGDIYIGFLERSLRMLRPGGRVGFICADRWMRNQYGSALRRLISDRYAVEHIWTMHDVDAFDREVAAYPAIIVLANRPQGSVVAAETTADFGPPSARALTEASRDPKMVEFRTTGVKAHRLPHWFKTGAFWPTGSPARLALIEHLSDSFPPLHDPTTGTRVSIGIATGADRVFVTRDPTVIEPERLLRLAMRHDLASGHFKWQGHYLINPWTEDGSLITLDSFPRLAAYLEGYPELRQRHVAKRNPRSWYRTIDKVHFDLIQKPKILIQDMKAHMHPVLAPGGYYPHHNLYYVTSDTWDLEVLGGLLLSRIAQAFIEAYCVRMRGGTLRFQAQYLKQIRVPEFGSIDEQVKAALRTAFRARDVEAATEAAASAYGIQVHESELA